MGFLLMSYEYQRAIRETSHHEAEQIRLENQVNRYTKRISKMESIFSKAKSQINSNYQQLSQMAATNISSAAAGGSLAGLASVVNTIVIGGVPLNQYISVPATPPGGMTEQAYVQQLGASARAYIDIMITQAKEAETEAIENQEDQTLEPIREKNDDLEAQAALEKTLLTKWQQRRDDAKQQLGADAKQNAGYTLG